jgi:hypothetical protein
MSEGKRNRLKGNEMTKRGKLAVVATLMAGLLVTTGTGCEMLKAFQQGYELGYELSDTLFGGYDDTSVLGTDDNIYTYGPSSFDDGYGSDFYSNSLLGTAVSGDLNNGGYIALGDGTFYP